MRERFNRREILKGMVGCAGLASVSGLFRPGLVMAQSPQIGTPINIVHIFLAGGPDGLALYPPRDGSVFHEELSGVRSSLLVPEHDRIQIHDQLGMPNPRDPHRAWEPLLSVVAPQEFAMIPSIEQKNITLVRSHSDSIIKAAMCNPQSNPTEQLGILARYARDYLEVSQAYFVNPLVPQNLGGLTAFELGDLTNYKYERLLFDDHGLDEARNKVLAGDMPRSAGAPMDQYYYNARQAGNLLIAEASAHAALEVGGNYGIAALKASAQIIKGTANQPRTRIFSLFDDRGSYDTHDRQGSSTGLDGYLMNLVHGLSQDLKKFVTCLKGITYPNGRSAYDCTVVVLHGEFGRTFRENGTGSSDHGRGGILITFGGRHVRGGVYGDHPAVADCLDPDYDAMIPTNSFADFWSELYVKVLGLPNSRLREYFPAQTLEQLGIFNSI